MLSKVASNKLVVLARFVSMLWDTRAAMVDAGSAQIPQHDLGQELPSIAIMFIKASVAWQVLCFASRHTDGFKINRNKIHITILLHCRTCSFKTLKLICYSFTCILTVSAMMLLPRTQVGAYTSGKTWVCTFCTKNNLSCLEVKWQHSLIHVPLMRIRRQLSVTASFMKVLLYMLSEWHFYHE
jgi:hypothetical protein